MIISVIPAKISYAGQSAITFVELLLVIIIIGVLVGVSIPQFRKTFDNLELDNFIKDIYYLACYLQASAISEVKIYCLNINQTQKEIYATYKDNGEFKPIIGRFRKTHKVAKDVDVYTDPTQISAIYFYPDGSIDNLTIALENKYKKVSLVIQGVAGGIQIQEVQNP